MKISSHSLLSVLALVCHNGNLVSAADRTGTIAMPIKVLEHCLFQVQASLAPNLSSIDLAYSASQNQKSIFSQEKAVCYVRVAFTFSLVGYVSVREVEYKGDFKNEANGEIETKIAWESNIGGPSSGVPAMYVLSRTLSCICFFKLMVF